MQIDLGLVGAVRAGTLVLLALVLRGSTVGIVRRLLPVAGEVARRSVDDPVEGIETAAEVLRPEIVGAGETVEFPKLIGSQVDLPRAVEGNPRRTQAGDLLCAELRRAFRRSAEDGSHAAAPLRAGGRGRDHERKEYESHHH